LQQNDSIEGDKLMIDDLEKYRIHQGQRVDLNAVDPNETGGFDGSKSDGKDEMENLTVELHDLQERLYAAHNRALLIILQGMDTAGKDGTIKHVFGDVNPQGIRLATFKSPTQHELDHDFLWRIHQKTPAKGEIVIFNRSQYEDVLVVRVHQLVPESVWGQRYAHINDFERMLTDEGTTLLKFFLYISKQEQKERLLDRLEEDGKSWKFNPQDLKERNRWGEYIQAYEEMLALTSTVWAPWYMVPANHKWFRNLFVASALVQTLKQLDPQFPEPIVDNNIEKYIEELREK
jgi:PPK2 family polyphosphate:nucleotide phosphotransferase